MARTCRRSGPGPRRSGKRRWPRAPGPRWRPGLPSKGLYHQNWSTGRLRFADPDPTLEKNLMRFLQNCRGDTAQGCHQVKKWMVPLPMPIPDWYYPEQAIEKNTWPGTSKIAVETLPRFSIKSQNGCCLHKQCQFRIDIIRIRPSKKTWSGTSKIIVWTMPRVAIKSKKMSVVRVGGFRPLREKEMYPDPT